MPPVAALRLLLRVALVVAGICLSQPSEWLGVSLILCNILLIDWLVCCVAQAEPSAVDEHSPAVAVIASAALSMLRTTSASQAEADALPRISTEIIWCCYCLAMTYQAKFPPPRNPWLLTAVNAELLAIVSLYAAPPEHRVALGIRAALFALLSVSQYTESTECTTFIQARGYLLCFLPVLVADYPVALIFACAGFFAIAMGEMHASKSFQDWPLAVQQQLI